MYISNCLRFKVVVYQIQNQLKIKPKKFIFAQSYTSLFSADLLFYVNVFYEWSIIENAKDKFFTRLNGSHILLRMLIISYKMHESVFEFLANLFINLVMARATSARTHH